MVDYYQILGLNKSASLGEIKLAYRNLAKKYHPDINSNNEESFKKINEAYSILSDKRKKIEYDSLIEEIKDIPTINYEYDNTQDVLKDTIKPSSNSTYSLKVKFYGTLFLVSFLFITISVPIYLSKVSSKKYFQKGNNDLKNGKVVDAIISYQKAINLFGSHSEKARIQLSRIYFYTLNNNNKAIDFIKEGIKNDEKSSVVGELKYLYGKILVKEGKINEALVLFERAFELSYDKDSLATQLGLIHTYYLNNYTKGLYFYDMLLETDSMNLEGLFGKAWCLQKLNLPKESIKYYNQLLEKDGSNGVAFFYRGVNNIVLGDTVSGCRDYSLSYANGYEPSLIYYKNQCR